MARLRWYMLADKVPLLTGFSLRHARCSHRSRLLGVRCWRTWTYDHFCGLHNYICWEDKEDRCESRKPLG